VEPRSSVAGMSIVEIASEGRRWIGKRNVAGPARSLRLRVTPLQVIRQGRVRWFHRPPSGLLIEVSHRSIMFPLIDGLDEQRTG
jgi:hypothetical protein